MNLALGGVLGPLGFRQHHAGPPPLAAPRLHGECDRGGVQLVDCLLDLTEVALAPVEARKGRPVRAVLGDVRPSEVEELDEQLAGEQRQTAALWEADLRDLARDDHLVGAVSGRADDAERRCRRLHHRYNLLDTEVLNKCV